MDTEADWLAALSEFFVSVGDRSERDAFDWIASVWMGLGARGAGAMGRETIALPVSSATRFQDVPKAICAPSHAKARFEGGSWSFIQPGRNDG
jgi:hypothetical protein